jgi:putative colanic acid biosynthesis UDP-glucose lipid carrier transferase
MAANSVDLPPHERSRRYALSDNSVILLSAFVLPAAAVAAFGAWMLVWRQELDGPHFLLGLLAFIAAGELSSPETPTSNFQAAAGGRELVRLTWRWAVVVLIAWAAIELADLSSRLNDRVLLGAALTAPFVMWLAQLGIAQVLSRNDYMQKKAVIVGLTDIGTRWESSLDADGGLGIRVIGFFDDREAGRLPATHTAALAGRLSDVPQFVRQNAVHIVYITLPMSKDPRVLALLDALRDSTVSIYFVPDILAFNPVQARIECIHGIPLLAVCESPFRGAAGLVKRAVDVFVALAALAVLAIPMLLIGIIVRLTSDGPVIFKQKRYGLDGEEIVVFKFRTMTVTEDGASSYTQVRRGDERVTPVGAFLRATSFDELPQLVNVLQGSMSIVGPRPHAVAVNEQYRQLIPSYMLRHKVKPGITGLAQVQGYRGGDDLVSMRKRIECDLAYVRHWSLLLDVRIITRTALLVWKDRNAF